LFWAFTSPNPSCPDDLLNTKIQDKSEVERKSKVPLLGSIGHNKFDSEIPVAEKPRAVIAESFRGLRTNLQYILQEDKTRAIAITSTISGEGKTFCAVNLAVIIAMSGKKTLLLGLDLRKPKIVSLFGLEKDTGLSTYLIGQPASKNSSTRPWFPISMWFRQAPSLPTLPSCSSLKKWKSSSKKPKSITTTSSTTPLPLRWSPMPSS
jgi:hypothetical protein